ncbi:MAG: 3',5'-cyclic adenosine monophosphate phosphodiesterase CpdA [Elusimicrobia bacterium]|nr:3',5'-cyclic adenosine monophosphate phosphodiesterase CpdA [Elusimicrobiota bacterium]
MKILQITDTHLFAGLDQKLCGMNTAESLAKVLELAKKEDWPPDLILATGDLSHDETELSYKRFLEMFEPLDVPVFCLPGNHDLPARFSRVLSAENVHVARQILEQNWQIVLLNSVVVGQNGGRLKQYELNYLDQCLSVHGDLNALVCLHHNVLPTQTSWLDTMTLKNSNELFQVLDQHPNVRVVLTGHIHQDFSARRGKVEILASPSTCIQFLPKSGKFSIDEQQPGYRWLELRPNGSIKTGVRRLENFTFTPDLSSRGY